VEGRSRARRRGRAPSARGDGVACSGGRGQREEERPAAAVAAPVGFLGSFLGFPFSGDFGGNGPADEEREREPKF
jgi:hypothetical protein